MSDRPSDRLTDSKAAERLQITPRELFEVRVPRGLASNPERVEEMPLTLQFVVTGPLGGTWTVDTLARPAACTAGLREDVQCTIQVSDTALLELIQCDPLARPNVFMKHVLEGSIEIDGDATVAMKLSKVFSIAEHAPDA